MKKWFITTLLILGSIGVSAQVSKKEALEHKIKSVSEWETDLRDRKPKPIQESFTRYDQMGNILEVVERNNEGVVTLHERYEYDKDGNKTVEYQLDEEGAVKKKHVYTYSNQLRISRKTYNGSDKLIAEKKYIYEFHK